MSPEPPVTVAMIAAVASNGVIGSENDLPWHIPEDLQYFKEMTLNKPIIMGRKTFDSVGKPLPRRCNIVVSRDPALSIEGAYVVATVEEALEIARHECTRTGEHEIMVVGGQQIYERALPFAERIYITEIELSPAGDAWFPALNDSEWKEVSCRLPEQQSEVGYRFRVLERATNKTG